MKAKLFSFILIFQAIFQDTFTVGCKNTMELHFFKIQLFFGLSVQWENHTGLDTDSL